ncbi:amino acid aminotransferase [Caldilinea sp.]|uniref:amino acid aminotransferase n=1 Tax=Caldilinea sp. TaxID=2293560 RepID=UPI002B6EC28C|nr:aspartate/tyrosine/aromatic aminotransferase [Anaerolineales bacterium]HQY95007.1 amino acid aminotransferase [Caldilinea sp.]HRA66187.1 amino acid aminotransferase [Caldilinea sp.]
MFDSLVAAPPDPILGLTETFKKDPNPRKVNLGVGVYKDAQGHTPVLASVKRAEEMLLRVEQTKNYLPIEGNAEFDAATLTLLLGADHAILREGRAVTTQAPGGTGALRVAADFIASTLDAKTVWLSDPTWPNHPNVFQAAGLKTATYPYFDKQRNSVDFAAMLAALQAAPTGDVVVLHGCCHNPTGVDLDRTQWRAIAEVVAARGLLPIVDFAYQGFADGLDEDATGLNELTRHCPDLLIASSYSKNFGLYSERVGALTLVAATSDAAATALSHIKRVIRANYSNPPAHGAAIVATVLNDSALRSTWEAEVREMRDRINTMRHLFVETLHEKGVDQDFSFIARQRGMFSFSGLTPEQVKALRERHAVYVVGSGRISVAGMTEGNMDYLCTALADVLTR